MKKIVIYLRVSSKHQGKSGLGLADQLQKAEKHVELLGGKILHSFQEVETGSSRKERPILKEALEICEKTGATLMVTRLDRLARDLSFIDLLLKSEKEVYFCDYPDASLFELRLRALMDQEELEKLRRNTKAALQQVVLKNAPKIAELEGKIKRLRKVRDAGLIALYQDEIDLLKLGNPKNFTNEGRQKGADARKAEALLDENNRKAYSVIKLMKDTHTFIKIAEYLNENNFKTPRGCKHTATSVIRINKMFEKQTTSETSH